MKRILMAGALAGLVLTVAAFTSSSGSKLTHCLEIDPITPSTNYLQVPANQTSDIYFFVRKLASGSTDVTVSETHTGNLSNLTFAGGSTPFTLSGIGNSLDVNYYFDAGAASTGNTIVVKASGVNAPCAEVTLTYTIDIV